MTAPLRNTQLYSARFTALTQTAVYTVPSGQLVTLRDVNLLNASGSANQVYLWAGLSTILNSWTLDPGGPGTGHAEWMPWINLPAGTVLYMRVNQTAGVSVVLSGKIYYV
jgi:hypothetical protein